MSAQGALELRGGGQDVPSDTVLKKQVLGLERWIPS